MGACSVTCGKERKEKIKWARRKFWRKGIKGGIETLFVREPWKWNNFSNILLLQKKMTGTGWMCCWRIFFGPSTCPLLSSCHFHYYFHYPFNTLRTPVVLVPKSGACGGHKRKTRESHSEPFWLVQQFFPFSSFPNHPRTSETQAPQLISADQPLPAYRKTRNFHQAQKLLWEKLISIK